MSLYTISKKISEFIRGKLREREIEKQVRIILKDDYYDSENKILKFEYEGKNIRIKIPDIRDHISFEIASNKKFFSHENLEDLRKFIPQHATIVDAGANIGNHSLFFAKICGAERVFSFEPQEEVFSILEANINLNDCKEIIIPFKLALGDKAGHASIAFREDLEISSSKRMLNTGGVFIKEDSAGDFQLDTLDNVLYSNLTKLDFMKIDVQGFEDKLLKGAKNTIKKFKPLVYLEVTTVDELNTKILPIMHDFNYKIKKAYTIDYLFEAYN